jgi:hypothetical protein
MPIRLRSAIVPSLALVLAACGSAEKPEAVGGDPALTGALADQIMVDPDLAGQNKGGAALAVSGPASAELPAEARSAEAIAAAKAEAVSAAGGTLQAVPAASSGDANGDGPISLAELASGGGNPCASKVNYTAGWAAQMPAAFPIYPRGHTQEAAGTDADGCKLRVVNFVTPVAVDDVLAFYFTRARGAGFDGEHRVEGNDHILGGSKDSAAYVVYARRLDNGLTEVDLVTNGA